jgi:ABC-type arginine transport system ATPase subunit
MIDLSRKKFHDEMKLTVTRAPTQETIKELRHELGLVKNIVDYWKEKSIKEHLEKLKMKVFLLKSGEKYIHNMGGLRSQIIIAFITLKAFQSIMRLLQPFHQ